MQTLTRWIIFAALAGGAPAAFAQETGVTRQATAAQAVAQLHDMTLQELFEKGGFLMYPLAALSIVALALVIYFAVILRREQLIPSRFVAGVQTLLREGKLTEARAACHGNPSAIAAVLEAALDYTIRSGNRPDSGLLREVVEGEGARQASLLQNQTHYLQDIGVLTPMIGLLGTVWGMLQAFRVVANDMARAKPLDLADGISLALITTIAGLCVAIPSMAAYFFFRSRSSRLIADLEVTTARLLLEIEGKIRT